MRSDEELKQAVQEGWYWQFTNRNWDAIFEGPANGDEEEYERILELLDGAELHIVWPSDDMPSVYRIVNEDGEFAKPKNKGYSAKPGESAWSTVKGIYTTAGRAWAAIRGGAGKHVERGQIVKWERLEDK